MIRTILFCLLFVAGLSLAAQRLPAAYGDKFMTHYAATIRPGDLMAHELFLADSLLEGRETGRRGQHLGALYVAAHFRRLGLAPAGQARVADTFVAAERYFQPYFLHNSKLVAPDSARLLVGDSLFRWKTDFFTLGASGLSDSLTGESVFGGNLETVDTAGLKGKLVWVQGSNTASSKRAPRARIEKWLEDTRRLRSAGAKGVFVILSDADYLLFKSFARTESELISANGEKLEMPVLMVHPAVARRAFAAAGGPDYSETGQQLREGQSPQVTLAQVPVVFRGKVERNRYPACNVAGYLEGTDRSDELLVISAHHDHIGITQAGMNRGADDDGSGTSALLELAEAFVLAAQEGHRPRRSILFLSFSGEEKGLYGSETYTDYPLYPLAFTVCNLNVDMIGRIGSDYAGKADSMEYIYLIGSDKLSSELHQISEATNSRFTKLKLDYTYNDEKHPSRLYYRSDHYNFAKNGIPVIFYFSGLHQDYHKPTDTPEKLLYPKMARITQLVFATAWQVANRDARLKVDKR